jgi:hypothetical protein
LGLKKKKKFPVTICKENFQQSNGHEYPGIKLFSSTEPSKINCKQGTTTLPLFSQSFAQRLHKLGLLINLDFSAKVSKRTKNRG